jgi:hypothetical protein
MTGDKDPGSPPDGIRAIEAAVRPIYELYGKDLQFRNIIYPGLGHVYTPEMWKNTLEWLSSNLKP